MQSAAVAHARSAAQAGRNVAAARARVAQCGQRVQLMGQQLAAKDASLQQVRRSRGARLHSGWSALLSVSRRKWCQSAGCAEGSVTVVVSGPPTLTLPCTQWPAHPLPCHAPAAPLPAA